MESIGFRLERTRKMENLWSRLDYVLDFGSDELGDKLMNERSVKVAIHKLSALFEDKTVLFVIDDV